MPESLLAKSATKAHDAEIGRKARVEVDDELVLLEDRLGENLIHDAQSRSWPNPG